MMGEAQYHSLPDGWERVDQEGGPHYYFNYRTCKTQWERPIVQVIISENKLNSMTEELHNLRLQNIAYSNRCKTLDNANEKLRQAFVSNKNDFMNAMEFVEKFATQSKAESNFREQSENKSRNTEATIRKMQQEADKQQQNWLETDAQDECWLRELEEW